MTTTVSGTIVSRNRFRPVLDTIIQDSVTFFLDNCVSPPFVVVVDTPDHMEYETCGNVRITDKYAKRKLREGLHRVTSENASVYIHCNNPGSCGELTLSWKPPQKERG